MLKESRLESSLERCRWGGDTQGSPMNSQISGQSGFHTFTKPLDPWSRPGAIVLVQGLPCYPTFSAFPASHPHGFPWSRNQLEEEERSGSENKGDAHQFFLSWWAFLSDGGLNRGQGRYLYTKSISDFSLIMGRIFYSSSEVIGNWVRS